jgi:hypothetical protein
VSVVCNCGSTSSEDLYSKLLKFILFGSPCTVELDKRNKATGMTTIDNYFYFFIPCSCKTIITKRINGKYVLLFRVNILCVKRFKETKHQVYKIATCFELILSDNYD